MLNDMLGKDCAACVQSQGWQLESNTLSDCRDIISAMPTVQSNFRA